MSKLYAISFESGVVPEGVTIVNGDPKPGTGYKNNWKWGLISSQTADEQSEVSFDLGSQKQELWVNFRFKVEDADFTTPDPLFDFGPVSLTLTAADNLRLSYGSDVDATITAISGEWNFMGIYVNLEDALDPAINVTLNGVPISGFDIDTTGGAISGSDDTLIIRSPLGKGSCLDDIRVDDSGTESIAPAEIEGHKSLPINTMFSQWTEKNAPVNTTTTLGIIDLTLNTNDEYFYAVDSSSRLLKIDHTDYSATVISTETNAANSSCIYHKGLNRVYFLADNHVNYYDGSTVTEDVSGAYFTGNDTRAIGSCYADDKQTAYIVSLATSGTGTDVIAVHRIDKDGNVDIITNGATDETAVNATATYPLTVEYDTFSGALIFPLFARSCMGLIYDSIPDAISYSAVYAASSTITGLYNARGLCNEGQFVAIGWTTSATTPTNHTLLKYSVLGNFSQYTGLTTTRYAYNGASFGRGVIEGRLCYHPYMNCLHWRLYNNTALYETHFDGCYRIKVSTLALPSVSSVFIGKINPYSNGVFVLDAGVLKELKILSSGSERNLVILDDAFLEEGTPNEMMSPVMSTIDYSSLVHSSNVILERATGRSGITVVSTDQVNTTTNLSATAKNICIKVENPLPAYRYTFTKYPSGHSLTSSPITNEGTAGAGQITAYAANGGSVSISTATETAGLTRTAYIALSGGGVTASIYIPTSSESISGDFTIHLVSTIHTTYNTTSTSRLIYVNSTFYVEGNTTIKTPAGDLTGFFDSTASPKDIIIGRSGNTLYFYIDGLLRDSVVWTDTFNLESSLYIGTNSTSYAYIQQNISLFELYTDRWLGVGGVSAGRSTPFLFKKS